MLGKKLNIPFYEIKETEKKLNRNDEIIYLGWVCATRIVGLNKVLKKYKVKCCGDENVQNIKNANNIKIPLFYMQGGIDYTKLNKIYKKLLQTIGKTIQNSSDNVDKEIVEMFEKGKSFVCEENIKEIEEYLK